MAARLQQVSCNGAALLFLLGRADTGSCAAQNASDSICQGHAPTFRLSGQHVLCIKVAGHHRELAFGDCMKPSQQTTLHFSSPAA